MKDYATEELGVTGGEWKHAVNWQCPGELKGAMIFGHDAEIGVYQRLADISARGTNSQKVCESNARLLAASKDLYNVLRAIIDDGARMSDYGHHWVEVDTAVFDEAEALLARLREATK